MSCSCIISFAIVWADFKILFKALYLLCSFLFHLKSLALASKYDVIESEDIENIIVSRQEPQQ